MRTEYLLLLAMSWATGCTKTVVSELSREQQNAIVALEPFSNQPAHCSGVVIDHDPIIAAAHCFGEDGLQATFGDDPRQPFARAKTTLVGLDREHDLVWLRFQLPQSTLRLIEPIPAVAALPESGADVVALGFGRRDDLARRQLHTHLGHVTELKPGKITITTPGGTCPGDSGGPLLILSKGRAQLVGVLWASARDHLRDVYTRVSPALTHAPFPSTDAGP